MRQTGRGSKRDAARNLSRSALARRSVLGEYPAVRMLYRALLIFITGLFITMWTLLIRSEIQPGNSLHALPVERVLRDVFESEKSSHLFIFNGTQRIGTFSLSGQGEAEDGTRSLRCAGNALIDFPSGGPQRSTWSGEIVVTPDWKMKTFSLTTASRALANSTGPATEFELLLSPLNQTASYILRSGRDVIDQQTFTMDEAGLDTLLDHFQIDPMWRKQLRPGQGPKSVVTARQASLMIDNMKLETALLSVTVNGQTLIEVHVNQLGEVLQAKTIFGWTLEPR